MSLFARCTAVILVVTLHAQTAVAASLVDTEDRKHPIEPYEQEFILTAYYSPLPGQCCYVRGGEDADKLLNGEGVHAADGTKVYPGMLAAPPTYAFGTRIVLPGLGTMTVHDRGGAIQEWDSTHRLDVWAGFGEEGLARALAFGVKHVRGMVYPLGARMPNEAFDISALPAPIDRLEPFMVADHQLYTLQMHSGDQSLSVRLVQTALRQSGFFPHTPTGLFGPETQTALSNFQSAYGLPSDGSFTTVTAAYLSTAQDMESHPSPIGLLDKDASPAQVQAAQRLLRFLGYYRGRTDGLLSAGLIASIVRYQQEAKLVADAQSPGAGTIGPLTKGKLVEAWKKRLVTARAARLLAIKKIQDILAARGTMLSAFLELGNAGPAVKTLQQLLASQGLFPADELNGVYGPLTQQSVLKYQLAHGLVQSDKDEGAGSIGPRTLQQMRDQMVQSAYFLVKARGWIAL